MPDALGSYDPDEENNPTIMRAALQPKNALQSRALSACKRKGFKSTKDRARWRKLEDKTYGGEERHIMFKAWMEHNIELAEKTNARSAIPVRIFTNLMASIENENRCVDWMGANKKKIMASKASAVKSRFGRQSDD